MLNLKEKLEKILSVDILSQLKHVPSMLLDEERALLYNYTRDIYTGEGIIIDAGPFLGGSTISLCQGLYDRQWPLQKTIDVFELFRTDNYMQDMGFNLPEPSFKSVFDNYLQPYSGYLEVYAGDIIQSNWQPTSIELLFIDLSKTIDINHYIIKTFFPQLIVGKSLVIQQDFIHEWTPWLAVTMAYFKDYFEYVTNTYINSVVYKYKKEIPRVVLDSFDLRSMDIKQALALYDLAVELFKTDIQKEMLTKGRKHLENLIIYDKFYADEEIKNTHWLKKIKGFFRV